MSVSMPIDNYSDNLASKFSTHLAMISFCTLRNSYPWSLPRPCITSNCLTSLIPSEGSTGLVFPYLQSDENNYLSLQKPFSYWSSHMSSALSLMVASSYSVFKAWISWSFIKITFSNKLSAPCPFPFIRLMWDHFWPWSSSTLAPLDLHLDSWMWLVSKKIKTKIKQTKKQN